MTLSTFTPVVYGSATAGTATYSEQYGGYETNGYLSLLDNVAANGSVISVIVGAGASVAHFPESGTGTMHGAIQVAQIITNQTGPVLISGQITINT